MCQPQAIVLAFKKLPNILLYISYHCWNLCEAKVYNTSNECSCYCWKKQSVLTIDILYLQTIYDVCSINGVKENIVDIST